MQIHKDVLIGEMLNTKSNLNMQKIKKGIDQKVNVNWLKYILILALACYKPFLILLILIILVFILDSWQLQLIPFIHLCLGKPLGLVSVLILTN